jgi:hypothetical protein
LTGLLFLAPCSQLQYKLPILHWLGFDKCQQAQRGAKKKETSYCHQKEKTKKNASKNKRPDSTTAHRVPSTPWTVRLQPAALYSCAAGRLPVAAVLLTSSFHEIVTSSFF